MGLAFAVTNIEGELVAEIAHEVAPETYLVRRFLNGDGDAFNRLVEICTPRAYAIALRMLGNQDDAQDVTQEAFLRAYQAIGKFRADSSFPTWLYRIVVNVCHDELARRKRRPAPMSEFIREDDSEIFPEAASSSPEPDEMSIRREQQQALNQAIAELPEIYRAVIILHDIEGLQYDEIASVLRTNLGTVKSRVNRGRNILREKILQERELFNLPTSQRNK